MNSYFDLASSLVTVAYLALAIGAIYVAVPWVLLRGQKDLQPMERFWSSLLLGTAYWMSLVLLLAGLRFHDVIGLLAGTLLVVLGCLALVWKVNLWQLGYWLFHHGIQKMLDIIEDQGFLKSKQRKLFSLFKWSYWAEMIGPWDYPRILIWELFVYGAYLRLHDSLTHYSFGFFDPYVHVVWLKELNHGHIFADGVYPRGYHAFLSAIGTFSGLDPVSLIRFAGGLMGSLLPVALYFLLLECQLPWSSALVGTALAAVCSPFYDMMVRQTAALPQEFAMVYALVSLAFAVRYLRTGLARDRWVFFAGAVVVWAAHTLVGIALLLAGVAMSLDYLFRNRKSMSRLGLVCREAMFASIVGNVPIVIGRLAGIKFHEASIGWVQGRLGPSGPRASGIGSLFSQLVDVATREVGIVVVVLVICGIPLVIFGLLRRNDAFPSPAFFSLWSLVLFGIWLLKVLGVNTIIPASRSELFLGMAACGVASWLYGLVVEPLMGKWVLVPSVRSITVAVTLSALTCFFYMPPPVPPHPQFEEAARLYYQLSNQLSPGTWTIIGQAEDYQLSLDRGYHLTVARFLSVYPPYVKHPNLPTPYTFIIVEKKPLDLPPSDEGRERNAEESLLEDWVRTYSAEHHDLHLYKETENVAIYVLYHPEAAREGTRQEVLGD